MTTLGWIDELPRLRVSSTYFMSLPEYSATVPTGTTIGKRWRCLVGSHDITWQKKGGKPRWIIREYVEIADPTQVGIRSYRPIIIVRAWQ